MKTPQEEVEEMKAKASSFYHTLGMTVRDSIKESIPLAELSEVADSSRPNLRERSPATFAEVTG